MRSVDVVIWIKPVFAEEESQTLRKVQDLVTKVMWRKKLTYMNRSFGSFTVNFDSFKNRIIVVNLEAHGGTAVIHNFEVNCLFCRRRVTQLLEIWLFVNFQSVFSLAAVIVIWDGFNLNRVSVEHIEGFRCCISLRIKANAIVREITFLGKQIESMRKYSL